MKKMFLILALVIAIGLLCTAGCTQSGTSQPATQTQVQTPVPVTSATAKPVTIPTNGMGTVGPTQTLPPQYTMDFQVTTNGDTANPMIQISIRGGNGFNYDTRVDVSLTTPDGKVQQKSMYPPFSMGQNVVFPCSTDKNHVEIWVTAPQVGTIKTYDEIVPFKQLNP